MIDIYNPQTGIYAYKGYKVRPHFDKKRNAWAGEVTYIPGSFVESETKEGFAENFVRTIDSYLISCEEEGKEPVPPRIDPYEKSRLFNEFLGTAPYEELIKSKKQISGLYRSGIIMKRGDLTEEQKGNLLSKRMKSILL